jgi:hypothetical protein
MLRPISPELQKNVRSELERKKTGVISSGGVELPASAGNLIPEELRALVAFLESRK